MQICPINREWVHNNLLEPYLQGSELINMAWKGVDRSLAPTHLSLSERVICWLQGVSLMVPFVNSVIWLAWQAFGKPEKLFDPFCPEAEPLPPPPPQVIVHQAAAPVLPIRPAVPVAGVDGAGLIRPTELFGFNEATDTLSLQTTWKIEHFPEMGIAQQYCDLFSSTSVYRPNLTLKEYHYEMGDERVHLIQNGGEGTPVQVRVNEVGKDPIERTFELEERIPLIQQRAVGLRPFVQSNDRELRFYAIIPKIPSFLNHVPFLAHAPFLMPVIATKMGEEEVPGHGRLLKIEIVSAWRWPYSSAKSQLWYDVASGQLRKFIDTGTFIPTKNGNFVPQNRLPG